MINVNNLTKSFNNIDAIKNLTIDINEGELFFFDILCLSIKILLRLQ